MRVISNKGVVIDMNQYISVNEEAVAVGNANMNARGDIIGPGGKIIKTREQLAADYHANNPKAVKKVALRDLASELTTTVAAPIVPSEPVAEVEEDARTVLPELDQEFLDPQAALKKAASEARKARKIEDKE